MSKKTARSKKIEIRPYDVLQVSYTGGVWMDYCTIREGEQDAAKRKVLAGEQILNMDGLRGCFRIVRTGCEAGVVLS